MRFDQSPHPLTEDHYHIQELIEGQEKRSADRTRHQNIEKQRDEFKKTVASFKDIEFLDFYCTDCEIDFVARARKQIDSWGKIAYYKIKHTCGKWCIRHITDKFKDAYFLRSKKLARERIERHNDTIQSFQNGYNSLYKK